MNGKQELDDLIMAASQPENDAAVARLLKEIKETDISLLKGSAENFDLLFDAWDESIYNDENKAAVCLSLAEKSILDSSAFRIALHYAMPGSKKKQLTRAWDTGMEICPPVAKVAITMPATTLSTLMMRPQVLESDWKTYALVFRC